MAFDWNTWARAANDKSGQPINYLSEKMPGGGTRSVIDKRYTMADPKYRAKYISGLGGGGKTSGPATLWSSQTPESAFYSPTGAKGSYQEINERSLSDPTIAKAVITGSRQPGAAAGTLTNLAKKIPQGVGLGPNETGSLLGGIGTKFSLAPEVMAKMWR